MSTIESDVPVQADTPTAMQRARLPLLIAGPVLLVSLGIWFYVSGGRYESTDDAYVMTARVAVSTNVPGRVVELVVHDNQVVQRGDLLFRLDPDPFRISVEEAQAQLGAAVLQVDALKASYLQQRSELASARETMAYQRSEFERQQKLFASGIASQSQVDRVKHAFDEARTRADSVQHELTGVLAQLGGNADIEPAKHPTVLRAQSALDRAKLNLSYTEVHAPSDGIVTRVEQLQVGSFVAASTPVFALVSAHDVWLDANFKEDQLAHMRPGQEAKIKVDSYPGKSFAGRVVSVSPGTGSQFSMLPAENATGNWVKVVQRVPVRIEFDHRDAGVPMHAGLSAVVQVDTRYQRHLFSANADIPAVAETATVSR
jgi:membrane fusion protein, multidrug efflux system